MSSGWYLGFDCATKTFAYSLGRIDLASHKEARARAGALAELVRRLRELGAGADAEPARTEAARLYEKIRDAVAKLDADTRDFVRVAAGATVDLAPGRADRDVSTVERVRALAAYVRDVVRPAIAAHVPPTERLGVVVEFQMGQNPSARVIAAALLTLFIDENVFIVGPSLKNKVHTCEAGRYGLFAERYKSSYSANKAHAKYNFEQIEATFGTGIPPTKPAALRGHIADSFMQIVGHLSRSEDEKSEPELQF
jgi:hypothetical protein